MKKILISILMISSLIFPVTSYSTSYPAINKPEIESKSAILIEQTSGRVLFEKNADEKRAPASVTKIMTALLVMEQIDSGKLKYTDMITASENASDMGGSQIYLEVGEKMSVHDLLKALMVASGNDSAVALGEAVGGTLDNFIKMMNDKAKQLGMKNTHFVNTNGLPDDNHYSSARDVAIMSRELLLKHPDITKFSTIWMDSLRNGEFQLANTNKLLKQYNGVTGLKTGFTTEAMHCLSASATRDNLNLISVILGGPSSDVRFEESKDLLSYGFDNFKFKETIKKDTVIATTPLKRGKLREINAVLYEDYTLLDNKNRKGEIEREITLLENVTAPVKKGQELGTLTFKKGDEVIDEVKLVAECDVKKMNYFDYIIRFFESFSGLIL